MRKHALKVHKLFLEKSAKTTSKSGKLPISVEIMVLGMLERVRELRTKTNKIWSKFTRNDRISGKGSFGWKNSESRFYKVKTLDLGENRHFEFVSS